MFSSLTIIAPFIPLPIDSGGKTRLYQELSNWPSVGSTRNFWTLTNSREDLEASKTWLKEKSITSQFFKQGHQKQRWSYLKTGVPYWFSETHSQELIAQLKNQSANNQAENVAWQVEFTQLLYLYDYLPPQGLKIFVAHDIATLSFWRRLKEEKNPLKICLHWWRWLGIYFYEKKYLPKYDLVIAMSEHDQKILQKKYRVKECWVVPNGLELATTPRSKSTPVLSLGYIGSTQHGPNKKALTFLINKISPALTKAGFVHRVVIAGKNQLNSKQDSPVVNLGPVENVADFYQEIDYLVAPIFSGSGTRIKILESLAHHTPVITTAIGAEGLAVRKLGINLVPQAQKTRSWLKVLQKVSNQPLPNIDKLTLENLSWQKIFADYFKKINENN